MSVIKENKEGHLRPTYSAATCKTPNAHSGCEKRPFSPSDVSSIVKTPSYTHDSSLRRYISFVNNSSAEQITLPVTPSVLPSYQG